MSVGEGESERVRDNTRDRARLFTLIIIIHCAPLSGPSQRLWPRDISVLRTVFCRHLSSQHPVPFFATMISSGMKGQIFHFRCLIKWITFSLVSRVASLMSPPVIHCLMNAVNTVLVSYQQNCPLMSHSVCVCVCNLPPVHYFSLLSTPKIK